MSGMFGKDRVFGGLRMDKEFEAGEHFVLFDAVIVAENIDLNNGLPPASKTALIVSRLDGKGKLTGDPFVVGTLAGPIAEKVREAGDDKSDLPAVVLWEQVDSNYSTRATVLTFVNYWKGDIPADLPTVDAVISVQDEMPA